MMRQIDLHGLSHEQAVRAAESEIFLYQTDLPIRIITGNSHRMRQHIIGMLQQHAVEEYDADTHYGSIIVRRL